MKYMGSKNRHAKDLIPIILNGRVDGQWYVEPFVGGFNMIDKVAGNRLASDTNFWLISLFQAVQSGWEPPDFISNEQYDEIRLNKGDFPPYLVGFVGFGCSYSGKFFGGYARGNTNKGLPRNYCLESKKNILNQREGIEGVIIQNKHFHDLIIPENSIVYCDPPYSGTTEYKDKFDHVLFWQWVRNKVNLGNKVFVSEYTAPEDFQCIWEKQVNNTLTKDTGSKQGVERLFVMRESK